MKKPRTYLLNILWSCLCCKVKSNVHQEPTEVQAKNCVLILHGFFSTHKSGKILYVKQLQRELLKNTVTNLSAAKKMKYGYQ